MTTPLCLRCTYLKQEETEGDWSYDDMGMVYRMPNAIEWFCHALHKYIRLRPTECSKFQPTTQTKFIKGENNMVKIDEIPSEGERIDLANLPQEMTLMAVTEKMKEATSGKTGGLVITYKVKDGRTFQQKYSLVSGAVLGEALKKLKIKDTIELQQGWYKYKLTIMRNGFPRMIPVEKVKEA